MNDEINPLCSCGELKGEEKTKSDLEKIVSVLSSFKYRFSSEVDLQNGFAKALDNSGIRYEKEKTLSPQPGLRVLSGVNDRPDFVIDGLAVEVKIAGGLSALLRQISRYASHPEIRGVLVVGTPRWIDEIPDTLCHKPISNHRIISSFF